MRSAGSCASCSRMLEREVRARPGCREASLERLVRRSHANALVATDEFDWHEWANRVTSAPSADVPSLNHRPQHCCPRLALYQPPKRTQRQREPSQRIHPDAPLAVVSPPSREHGGHDDDARKAASHDHKAPACSAGNSTLLGRHLTWRAPGSRADATDFRTACQGASVTARSTRHCFKRASQRRAWPAAAEPDDRSAFAADPRKLANSAEAMALPRLIQVRMPNPSAVAWRQTARKHAGFDLVRFVIPVETKTAIPAALGYAAHMVVFRALGQEQVEQPRQARSAPMDGRTTENRPSPVLRMTPFEAYPVLSRQQTRGSHLRRVA